MVKLVHELESQQLANLILKNQIANLQANTNQKIQKSLSNSPVLFKSNGVSYSPITSASNTPSPITNNESKLNSLLNLNQFQSDDQGSLSSNNKSPDDKEDNINNDNENVDNGEDSEDDEQNSDDELMNANANNDESNDNETTTQAVLNKSSTSNELNGGNYQTFFKTKQKDSSKQTKLNDLNDSTAHQSKSRTSSQTSPKTPKSALLERRRKAVFELLIQDTYPSGKLILFFSMFNAW